MQIDLTLPAGFMGIETSRQSKFFTRDKMAGRGVTIIGAGATGSPMAVGFAKLGVDKIEVWDDDVVESHNLSNQMYGPQHLGMAKVDALRDVVFQQTGTIITTHNRRVGSGDAGRMKEIVCVLVDSMDGPEGRRGIAEQVIFGSRAEFVIETRMGVEHGMIYSINPRNMVEYRGWLNTLYSDADVAANEDADPAGCNAQQTIGATVRLITGLAEWQFLNWLNDREYSHEITVCVRPLAIDTNQFMLV